MDAAVAPSDAAAGHEAFRREVAGWLETQLSGPFAHLRGIADLCRDMDERRRFERALGEARLSCVGWPEEYGGRGAGLEEQVIFAEEYARAEAPARIAHVGVELAGPTILLHGTEDQKRRFLPRIASGEDIWCQGYSEPNAGSDLANVQTRAVLEDGRWRIDGQKVWTSIAQASDWSFVICRTEPGSRGSKGLSYILVPMRQPGVTVRPIKQMTGETEFNEVFFDAAYADDVVGRPGDGWRVAMDTLKLERGVSTFGQQMHFRNQLTLLIAAAKANGKAADPAVRRKIADAWIGLEVMRQHALRMLAEETPGLEGMVFKLYWSSWRQQVGELSMEVLGPAGEVGDAAGELPLLTSLHLQSRAETIYAGSSEIQRNIIAEQGLRLPREPREGWPQR
ncbi:acyl-CoA dehydrogenase family protein [Phenylobacterium sp.]|jgi:alkylation response protein AidB-like acyl-CoA dehydrogenase|uniref:acyl-CoA dehydrogenase family protein n=1 Tax=Phenylobacterium sp. TaxID=1871053 RepID=UPI002F3F181B